jgi:hypothetical protein
VIKYDSVTCDISICVFLCDWSYHLGRIKHSKSHTCSKHSFHWYINHFFIDQSYKYQLTTHHINISILWLISILMCLNKPCWTALTRDKYVIPPSWSHPAFTATALASSAVCT